MSIVPNRVFVLDEPCKFVAVSHSECPLSANMKECHSNMNPGDLCEADKPLPDGNTNYDVNNCGPDGSYDIFRCVKGKHCYM